MSTSTGVPNVSIEPQQPPQLASLGWALRRAALGLLMLFAMAMLTAWLLYASIDPDEAAASAAPPSEAADSAR
ncbi:MAG: hypothetical protein F9K29_01550 [Hyphomicrobiaceae bacterium]|nr:MAG: hypothetical protein F9K29_01550 [Hyphomicrobiaceae bacterium]